MKKIINISLVIVCLLMGVEVALAQSNTLNKANDYFDHAEYSKSIELYKKVLKKNESDKIALEQIAHAYRLINHSVEAEQWYQRAMVFNSNNSLLKYYYAQALMTNGKYTEAAKYFEEYAQKVPYDQRGKRFAESCRNISNSQLGSEMYQLQKLGFNSTASESNPSFYKGGLVFTSAEAKSVDIYYTQAQNQQWTNPTILVGMDESNQYEGAICFNKSGNKAYFSRNVGRENQTGKSHLKMYEADLVGNQWTNVRELPFNDKFYSVAHPALSADGHTLYFSSDMSGGYGGKDLYKSMYENGTWTKPRNLGNTINTEGDEINPFAQPNGALYYASNGLGGFGGFDVFGATPISATKWKTENVGTPINSSSNDFGLILTDDFKLGYFSSNRKGGKGNGDIYQITINEAKAAEMLAKASDESSLHTFSTNYRTSKGKKIAKSVFSTEGYMFQKDLKLVLVGIVLNEETKEPIEGAQVILEDLATADKQEFITQNDGNFYFKLEAERKYKLFKMNVDGFAETPKSVSTINSSETQILHAVLESASASINVAKGTPEYNKPQEAHAPIPTSSMAETFVLKESEETAMSSTYNNGRYSDSQLVFKIQIGAFRQKLEAGADFLSKAQGNVETEKTRNGLIRYMMGTFDDFTDAEQFRIRLLRKGYTKAFVAAYINNVRLDMPVEEVLQRY
ncbi:MAG: tetratricopeptide repeat protein [Chitinophagales bacterium]